MKQLGTFSIGVGDRFAHQANAQLQACILAEDVGVHVIPVWNKSNREHMIIGSEPTSVRTAADAAVKELGWNQNYFCDADHINFTTVDRFLPSCDFYTIDVADYIGAAPDPSSLDDFVSRHAHLIGSIPLRTSEETILISDALIRRTAERFLHAVQQAGKVYRHVANAKGAGNFIAEISMDETDAAQSPGELLIILAAIADEQIPIQTIAPKFSGRFNKGVDYVGNVEQFSRELVLDIGAIDHAVSCFGLPANLKLSIHSGSDKFSIYPAIHAAMEKFSVGVHLKTAGTTWLEEVTGLAEAGGDALELAKEIYAQAFAHSVELCAPYATVIDIDTARLPAPSEVSAWSSEKFTGALRNNPLSPRFNPSFRQLLHVGFKVAAKLGHRYLELIESNEEIIAQNVTDNLFRRHIAPVFLGQSIVHRTDG